jgi:hypothetical protein
MTAENANPAPELIWGVRAIGEEIGLTSRQTFHLLEQGHLPATHVGKKWCSERTALREFILGKINSAPAAKGHGR